jgi:hypothetical protein
MIILAIVVIGGVISYGYFSNYIQNYNSEINKTKYLASQPTINVTGIIQHWEPIDGPSYSIIPEEDIDVEMNEYRGIFLYGKLNPSLEGKRVTISGILIENYADFHSKTLGGAFGGDPHTATILVENVFSSEPDVTDSLTIPNAERDAKLSAGYKLYPGVGWVHPDDLGTQLPIYRDNPNNPGELILDIDAMIKAEESERLSQVLRLCENTDAQYLGALSFENSTHHIDSQTCTWRLVIEN